MISSSSSHGGNSRGYVDFLWHKAGNKTQERRGLFYADGANSTLAMLREFLRQCSDKLARQEISRATRCGLATCRLDACASVGHYFPPAALPFP